MAASNNDIHMLDFCLGLEKHSNIDMKNDDGWTPAHLAGFLNNFDAMNLLLENGANLAEAHKNNLNVYEEIVRAGHADLLGCIYKQVKVLQNNRKMGQSGTFSLLHLAASTEGYNCLEFLLAKAKENPN